MILLRTLTMLSKFGDGKYKNQKVETIIKIDPGYIRHSYFHLSKISFDNECLHAVGITEEYRIKKPGKDKEMNHKFNLDQIKSMSEEERLKHFTKKKKQRVKNAKLLHQRHINDDKRMLSKSSLKSINNRNTTLDLSRRAIAFQIV